ncbi:E3 ubiquitin-protein ligase TRIM71-like [Mya arenaria]|uniref:E3 ubiquitin-protein ligase TRIM71-like n=1 Tax=Mya arenaria TaxID=6604 RepID=UPI0022DEBACF|nr:E3 ubiquitin-protein ligase TRIM71-like [Mya arenaria]
MEVPGKKLQAGPSTADTTYCQPCEQDDEILPAEAYCTVCKEFFCSKCASLHRKQKMSRSHALLDKSNMLTSISVIIEDEYKCTELRDIHHTEIIKYFCPTHHTLNCGHCVVHNHRTCHVDVISDVSKAFKDGHEYGDIIKTIACLFEDIDSCASDVEKNVEAVAKLCKNEINKLRRYREEVNKYFEEREQALLKLIEETKNMDEELLGSLKPKYDNLKSKLAEINVTLEAQENNVIQLFIETKKAKKPLEGLQNDLADIKKNNVIHHYEFRKDPATERLIASATGLGTLEHIMTEPHKIASASDSNHVIVGRTVQGDGPRENMASSNHTVMQAIPDMTRLRFTLAVGIRVKSATAYTTCYLASMLHLSESRMLLADLYNNTVKLVDLQTSNIVSQISVPGVPWGICHLPGDKVAVTMLTKGIQFLKTEGQLSLGDRIKVDIDCRGIAFHEDTLIVSFNRKVAVLDMNGHAIKDQEVSCQSGINC